MPADQVSATVTGDAVALPELVTVMSQETRSPTVAVAPEDRVLVTERAGAPRVTVAVADLGVGSLGVDTSAVLVVVPAAAVAEVKIENVEVSPEARLGIVKVAALEEVAVGAAVADE